MFIGVSEFQDPGIEVGGAPGRQANARRAETARAAGRGDPVGQPPGHTGRIRQVICQRLPQITGPGDLVIIYWSGHGGRVADENGDEKDGFDEYLVPYDGQRLRIDDIRQTMLVDDTFGRWMQGLDGRQIVLVLDTCYAGGQPRASARPRRPAAAGAVRLPRRRAGPHQGHRPAGDRHAGLRLGRSESVRRREGT